MIPLFDRIIDITFYPKQSASGVSVSALKVHCPRTGMKPDIQLSGSFAANIIYDATLKIGNFYAPDDLVSGDGETGYKWVKITAGYRESLVTDMEGQLWTGFNEKPCPDGITVFTFMTGWFEEWVTKKVSLNFKEGDLINDVLKAVCEAVSSGYLSVELDSALPKNARCVAKVSADCSVADFCVKFARANNLTIIPEGNVLRVNDAKINPAGGGKIHKLEYVTDVKKTAAGVTITAPWVPSIRPGDYVRINPKYFSADVSAMFVKLGQDFLVINESFSFGTLNSNNQMILTTVGKQS